MNTLALAQQTLLVVDDEKQNRLLLTELFHGEYKVIQAKNGLQALEHARNHNPDLILLDVLMPEMSGMEVIRALKQDDNTRNIPVIFITALDSRSDEERGLDLGAVDYIAKPFHPSIVRVRVRNHMRLVQQHHLLEKLAALDGLTGIPNRRHFDQTYGQEWRRSARKREPLSLIIADVDLFKMYNDTLGHAAGDRVLQDVANILRQGLRRPGDFVARYGGEEFVLVLPQTNIQQAEQVVINIQRLLETKAIAHPASSVSAYITLSLGGICVTPPSEVVDAAVFIRADEALYQAKTTGRNKLCWAE